MMPLQQAPQCHYTTIFVAPYCDSRRFVARNKGHVLDTSIMDSRQSRLHAEHLLMLHCIPAAKEVILRIPIINTSIIRNGAISVDSSGNTASTIVQDERTSLSRYLQRIPLDVDDSMTGNIIILVTPEIKEKDKTWTLSVGSIWIPPRHKIFHGLHVDAHDLLRRLNADTMSPGIRSQSTTPSWTSLHINGVNGGRKQLGCPDIPIASRTRCEEEPEEEVGDEQAMRSTSCGRSGTCGRTRKDQGV